jgi:hypothetical protein
MIRCVLVCLLLLACDAGKTATPVAIAPSPAPTEETTLSINNGTTLDVTLVVNGQAIETVHPGVQVDPIPPSELPTLPWMVEARSPSGRVLSSMAVRQGDVTRTANGIRGDAVRVDLSCGRLDVWAGPPLLGPAPGPGRPGDCAP